MKTKLTDIEARLVHETDDAWLLDTGGEETVWVPKSMAEFDGETLVLSEHAAINKGLI
ncbi:MAG: hypothetical protein NXI17_05905 [Alphaproteobacteria bacterium]|nr:hypothetical protein [Alphaproteobacteria bacterium]